MTRGITAARENLLSSKFDIKDDNKSCAGSAGGSPASVRQHAQTASPPLDLESNESLFRADALKAGEPPALPAARQAHVNSSFLIPHSSFFFFISFTCFALFLFGLLPLVTHAHKFHASFTEIAYNAEERSAEIIIRTFPDDLENALTKRANRPVRLDESKETEALVFAYLQDTFELKRTNGKPLKLSWVGLEAQVDLVRIYVEAKGLPAGLDGTQIRHQFLCELFEDQLNAVNLRDSGKQAALIFKPGDKFQSVAVK